MSAVVEIAAVGNELLEGVTQDTNTHWLCRSVTALGSTVRRAVIVRDDRAAIAAEVQGAQARHTDLLLVTGGLGPTADDLTLEGVAQAAGAPLAEHPQARAMVARRYEELHRSGAVSAPDLTPERLKMACLPQGAEPIENPVGAAPAVLLALEGTCVVCLPGVPRELQAIFAGPLQPVLARFLGAGLTLEREVMVRLGDESAMAAALSAVAALHPGIYIKSHARDFQRGQGIRVTLSARGTDRATLEHALDAAISSLRQRLPLA
ncbi:MAG: competence/damage-inducible protein A [Armatimonadetes bacterium]|nr:competence/damage-inducible protein A [Armatimonadota bacterium]